MDAARRALLLREMGLAPVWRERAAAEPGVVALTYGVDYWDYLGWNDTFARPKFAERQRAWGQGGPAPVGEAPQPSVIAGRSIRIGFLSGRFREGQGLDAVLGAVAPPGSIVAVDALTYPGFKLLAAARRIEAKSKGRKAIRG